MARSFIFKCPHCGQGFELQETWADITTPCPNCGGEITLPRMGSEILLPRKAPTVDIPPIAAAAEPVLSAPRLVRKQTAPPPPPADPPAGRWRRYWARTVDITLFSLLLWLLLPELALEKYGRLFLLPLAFITEDLLYAAFHTTPGKFLFGCRVVDRNGRPLTPSQYAIRNFFVYVKGFWCGFFSIIPMILQSMRLHNGQPTTYDEPTGYSVVIKR